MIFQPSKMEENSSPSLLNTSTGKQGVPAALQTQAENELKYNGIKIQDMRDNPLFSRHDDIDKIGIAQKKVAEAAQALSKSKYVRELNRKMNHPAKPNYR